VSWIKLIGITVKTANVAKRGDLLIHTISKCCFGERANKREREREREKNRFEEEKICLENQDEEEEQLE
jgi:hypothetical protein